jgi:hypothetical protein
MIKTISQAKAKEIYGDYAGLVNALLFISLLGSSFSGFTEWYGFTSDAMAEMFPILYPTMGVLLIESSRLIIPLLFLTIFRLIRNPSEWKKRLPALILLLIVSVILIFLSIKKSEDGINNRTVAKHEFKDSIRVDDSKYNLIIEGCNNAYQAEINAIESEVESEYEKDLRKEKEAARQAKQRISEIKHVNATWATSTVAAKSNVLSAANSALSQIQKDIANDIRTKKDVALSNLNKCKKEANDTLLLYSNKAEHSFNKAKSENEAVIDRKIMVNNWIMYVGIFFIILYSFVKEWLNHVSERDITYEFDETDNDYGFFQKLATIGKSRLQNVGDSILISLSKSDSQKKSEAEQKRIAAEQKRIAEAATLAQQKAELAALKQKAELQKAQLEAATQKVLDDAKTAAIEAERKREQIAATTLAEQKRLKELAAIELENEKARLKNEATQREQQQEVDRLKRLQQEVAEREQQEVARKQEIATRKALAEKAERLAAEKAENDRNEQQEIQRLATANATLNRKTATGKNAVNVEATTFVDDLFTKYTSNGTLELHKDLKTAITNYRKRWESATESLKDATLSEGRRNQKQKSADDNQTKYEYAIEKAADMNVEMNWVDGKLEMNYIN